MTRVAPVEPDEGAEVAPGPTPRAVRRPATLPAVVIVTHDTRDEALEALESVRAAGASEVVVVDSGSRDGTARAVRDRDPLVRVLELANVGFGRGANAGIRVTSTSAVVVANADVRFDTAALSTLGLAFEEDPRVAAVGPRVTYPGGAHQASARRRPDALTAIGHAILGRALPGNRFTRRYRDLDADSERPREVDWLSGCALALRRGALEEVGGFDPGYFLYMEDVDLGDRLRAAGWRLRYEPAARVVHRVGASTSGRPGRSLLLHAHSLDRYLRRRYADVPFGGLARPAVRVGLAVWVALTWVVGRLAGRGRSSTGERTGA